MSIPGLTDNITITDLERRILAAEDVYSLPALDLFKAAGNTDSPEVATRLLEDVERLKIVLFSTYLRSQNEDWLVKHRKDGIEDMVKRLRRLVTPSLGSRTVNRIRGFLNRKVASASDADK